jgi:hypothetical protein
VTKQEIFDRVWRHFVTEGQPLSYSFGGSRCMFRGHNGAKCAVGVLFPDEEYDEAIEVATSLRALFGNAFRHICPPSLLALAHHEPLLIDLQRAHDNPARIDAGIRERLTFVAHEHALTIPEAAQ